MTVLKYRDFQGVAHFEDGHLIVEILHIDDLVTAVCDKASEVQKCFEDLVDEYVETCAEVGKSPCRPYKGTFNVRISPELHKAIAYAAVESRLSLNAWVEKALQDKVDRSVSIATVLKNAVEHLDRHVLELQVSSSELQNFVWSQAKFSMSDLSDTDSLRREAALLFTAH